MPQSAPVSNEGPPDTRPALRQHDQGIRLSDRHTLLRHWTASVLGRDDFTLEPASSDASFRRYWRVRYPGHTLIVMDAPPAQEDCGRFVDLARRLRAIGLHTPDIHAEDLAHGFLALSDLGERLYLTELDGQSADRLYGDALTALTVLQSRGPLEGLPAYDAPFLRRELAIFHEWFVGHHLRLRFSPADQAAWERTCDTLIANALEQPQVCVHRDYHSRNLMLNATQNPGILDFQDAVVGPITYDPVSLLKDCYIQWPSERVTGWALGYLRLAVESGVTTPQDPTRFLRWFDLMGAQRHLKAAGIFARLHHRDHKPDYLQHIPRTLGYVREVCARYSELSDLDRLLAETVLPNLEDIPAA